MPCQGRDAARRAPWSPDPRRWAKGESARLGSSADQHRCPNLRRPPVGESCRSSSGVPFRSAAVAGSTRRLRRLGSDRCQGNRSDSGQEARSGAPGSQCGTSPRRRKAGSVLQDHGKRGDRDSGSAGRSGTGPHDWLAEPQQQDVRHLSPVRRLLAAIAPAPICGPLDGHPGGPRYSCRRSPVVHRPVIGWAAVRARSGAGAGTTAGSPHRLHVPCLAAARLPGRGSDQQRSPGHHKRSPGAPGPHKDPFGGPRSSSYRKAWNARTSSVTLPSHCWAPALRDRCCPGVHRAFPARHLDRASKLPPRRGEEHLGVIGGPASGRLLKDVRGSVPAQDPVAALPDQPGCEEREQANHAQSNRRPDRDPGLRIFQLPATSAGGSLRWRRPGRVSPPRRSKESSQSRPTVHDHPG